MWLWWVLGGLAAWTAVALFAAVIVGRGIGLAERREIHPDTVMVTADLPGWARLDQPRVARRRVPLPPLGVALAGIAVALETTGFVLRQGGDEIGVLSMDAPYSLPRMYVATIFAAAAFAAVAGASTVPGRRAWWTAVGLVTGVIAAVKTGSTVHAQAMSALVSAVGVVGATAVCAVLAVAVLVTLFALSRTERRDRRRVLGALGGYAVAAVGLSAISSGVGPAWSTAATYVEESGEALAAVAVLVAVLVGVAPRLVLPASWRLHRESDADTLELSEQLLRRRLPRHTGR